MYSLHDLTSREDYQEVGEHGDSNLLPSTQRSHARLKGEQVRRESELLGNHSGQSVVQRERGHGEDGGGGGVERVTRVVGREKRERERERTRRKRAGRGREERVEGRKTLGGHSSI